MLAFRIHYLTGVVAAQDRADRRRAEWPPHPDRLFSALVASWGRGGRGAAGKAALAWLEEQAPPHIACSRSDRVGWRDAVTHYVPRNDLPDTDKGRNARTFPAAVPENPVVHIIWPDAAPGEHRKALMALAEGVAWLGHSSTLVSVRVMDEPPPPPRYVPAEHGDLALRVPSKGRFDVLEAAFHDNDRLAPPGAWVRYAEPGQPRAPSPSAFGDWVVFRRVGGIGMELRHTNVLTHAVHRALVKLADERNDGPVRSLISGRDPDGGVTRGPHIAVVPLANLGHPHADGAIMGFAVVYPGGIDDGERAYLDRTLADLDHVKTAAGVMGVKRLVLPDRLGLNPSRYTKAARQWVTVTPVLLDRFPKKGLTIETIVARAVEAIGLPSPAAVTLGAWPVVAGVPHPRLMLPRPGRQSERLWLHAMLTFAEPVRGPVLIGAGRFFGQGLCLPMPEPDRKEAEA